MGTARIDVTGSVRVRSEQGELQGAELGGRRSRVALVALALHRQPLPAQRLAEIVWSDSPPSTWPAALRNVIRDLRDRLAPIGLGGHQLITTTPIGYGLAGDVSAIGDQELKAARHLIGEDPRAALLMVEKLAEQRGEDLLPGEDAVWLLPFRATIDRMREQAQEFVVQAAAAAGDHQRAVTTARTLVTERPLSERSHRLLIGALDGAGDRAGAVRAFEQCRTVLADQLGVDPSAETVDVYLRALRSFASPPGTRLPAATGGFVGRAGERRALESAVGTAGCVTLVGRGGVGKSRLALEVATAARGTREVLWVGMDAVTADELAVSQIAVSLQVPATADPAGALTDRLAPLGAALLVLDGVEHVADGIAGCVTTLTSSCPELTVLVTSRSPLRVEQERVLPVGPFTERTDAVLLLTTRMRETGRDPTDAAADPITTDRLCDRCAGLPLALELTAAQLTDISVADLLDELPDEPADRLAATLRYSYDLLAPHEAEVFRHSAVLVGPVGLPMLRFVESEPDHRPARLARTVRELTAVGLLVVDRTGARWRYRMDDDVRRFAAQLLRDAGEEAVALTGLAGAVSALLPDDARSSPALFAPAVTEVLGCVRAVLGAAADGRLPRETGLELAFRLHRYWAATSVAEGRYWLSRLLHDAPDGYWTGLATFAHGYLVYWTGDAVGARPVLAGAVQLLRGVEDGFAARALIYLAGITDDLDDGVTALASIREAADLARSLGDHNLYVGAAMGVGSVLAERGDAAAVDAARVALDDCRLHGGAEQLATALPTAAMIAWQVGDLDQSREWVAEGRAVLGSQARIAHVTVLTVATGLALADGRIDEAIGAGRAADTEATALGVDRELPLIRCLLARALCSAADIPGAVDRAIAAVAAAAALSYHGPLALALETAVEVLTTTGGASTDVEQLSAAAVAIRVRGDRPAPPTVRGTGSGPDSTGPFPAGTNAPTLSPDAVAALAISLLEAVAR